MSRLRTLGAVFVCSVLITANEVFAKSAIGRLGDLTQVIIPAYAFGMAMNEKDWNGAGQFIYSFGMTEISVFGLKSIVDEKRPDGSDKNSFPSGHAAAAFSGATFIHKRYGIKRAILPYLMAGFTGYSRISADKHYLHDVVAGAVISGLFTWIFVDKYGVQVSAGPEFIKVGFRTEF
ncbi:MAG: phosphatase PAP2 family protein [Rickettsiales bacterium]|jgi:membrane-associated phospholipid phosphatase|nr:phosphatase PAP2 family protein [Rickettsiales bacterium]